MRKLYNFIKRKLPATFGALEHEVERILLNDIRYEDKISQLSISIDDMLKEMVNFKKIIYVILENKEKFTDKISRIADEVSLVKEDILKSADSNAKFENQIAELSAGVSHTEKIYFDIVKLFESVQSSLKAVSESSSLNNIKNCRWDHEYDSVIIPINRFIDGSGAAVSMHLTSVANKPDSIVYETADIIRTSALSLVADEINSRFLNGNTAELGVANGKFARVINAMFPSKELHLFDTFEGFPESDLRVDREMSYSNASEEAYANIDIDAVLGSMPYPDKCIVHKGYFPDTADGLDEQFCFVSIDCDLYKPICEGLKYFYPRLVKGGCIFVHDYRSKFFTGVKEALEEFSETNGISYCVLPDNTGTAILMK